MDFIKERRVKVIARVMMTIFFIFIFNIVVDANPYPSSYTDSDGVYHPGNCTWQAWQETYNRLGIQLPAWGNAGNWYDNAKNAGYTVMAYSDGVVPPANSIACWSGHVAYILSADSVGANVIDGNILINGQWMQSYQSWYSWQQLKNRGGFKGFIILQSPSISVSYSNLGTEFVDNWNACLMADINNPSGAVVSQVGAYIWDESGACIVNHVEDCGLSYTTINQKLNIVAEAKADGLLSGKTYTWQFFAIVNDNVYYSDKSSFTTVDNMAPVISDVSIIDKDCTGYTVKCKASDNVGVVRVAFPSWTTNNDQDDLLWKDGAKDGEWFSFRVNISAHNNEIGEYRTHIYAYDSTGNSVMYTINSIIMSDENGEAFHNYSSEWIVDKEATDNENGSKSRHCTICDAKTDIIVISNKLSGRLNVNNSTASINASTGDSIDLVASATGGNGEYTYKFAVLNVDTGKWSVLRDFSSSSTYTYSLDYAGNKQFAVTVKDSEGSTVATNRISVSVTEKLSGKLTIADSTSAITKQKGSNITLKANGSGGSGSYTYKFAVLNVYTGKWSVLRDFSSNQSYDFTLNYTGKKQFAVTVKDSTGNTIATNRILVNVTDELSGKLTVAGSTNAITKTRGSKITLTALGSGGSESYTYKFAVLNVDTGKWTVLREFSSSATYDFTLNYTGKKQFAVTVKDSTGKTVATNRLDVNVIEALNGVLKADGSTGVIEKKKGSKINLSTTANGGSGSYTYKFAVLNVDTGKWSVIKDFSAESIVSYSLNYSGVKQFAVTVKDSTGNTIATNRISVLVTG